MPGTVHVFNLTNQDLELVLNGVPVECGPIAGWSGPSYQLRSGAVPRSASLPGPVFVGITPNHLSLNWPDGTFTAQVLVDLSVPLNQDMMLLIGRNQWHMVTPFGAMVTSGPVNSDWGG